MKFFLLGLSHKTAPLHIREKLDFSKKRPDEYLKKLKSIPEVASGAVLSTCNRVEVYVAGEFDESLQTKIKNYLEEFHGHGGEELSGASYYVKQDQEAIQHLFRVTASLDSLVVGEPQISGQVKEAYFISCAEKCSDPYLDRVFQKAFSVAKKVRTETKIGEQAVSISYAAVELAKKIFSDLGKTTVMIIGAGEMAELCARHLKNYAPRKMIFVNRTYEQSVRLAEEYHGIPIEFAKFKDELADADIVITSTGAAHHILTKADVERAIHARRQNPVFMIDISVPRNVDPGVNDLEDVYLYNIDDLQGQVEVNLSQRKDEALKAEKIIDEEVGKFQGLSRKLTLAPIVRTLQEKYHEVSERELERLEKKLSKATLEERNEIKKTMESLLRKILNDPILYLTRNVTDQDVDKIENFAAIFGLYKEDSEP